MEWPDGWLASHKGGYVLLELGSLKEHLLPHQLTIHNRIKYLFLHLEEPQGLVKCLGTKINQKKHSLLNQRKSMKLKLGKAEHF